MSNLGIGVMINRLFDDGGSVRAFQTCMGKQITSLDLSDDELIFTFTDGVSMKVWDAGQSCCEIRYMHSDDDLSAFIGSRLISAEIRQVPTQESEYGEPHEIEFLLITTSVGVFTIETHNIHNGYYGGFYVKAALG